jgi:hypothetical protein
MHAHDGRQVGVICAHNPDGTQLGLAERALLDALAERLAAAVVAGTFPNWRQAPKTAREVA